MLPNASLLCRRRKPRIDTFADNTAELRPQASALALRGAGTSQLLIPASTPRSYGRRHRSWHHGHVRATHIERRRGQRPVHHDQVHAWRRGRRPKHYDKISATHNERRRGQRPWHCDQISATHNLRRREQ
jgi:hypothetical protein